MWLHCGYKIFARCCGLCGSTLWLKLVSCCQPAIKMYFFFLFFLFFLYFFSNTKKMPQHAHSVNTGESSNYKIEAPASLSSNTGSTKRKEISVSFLYGSDDRASS